jgi:flagellar export protein FliJ
VPRDPLSTLIRLRRSACEDAQHHVVRCLSAEAQAERAALEVEHSIARETQAASDPSGPDSVVEAFAAWLPGARRRLEEARRTLETLQAETARARAGLSACKTALESVETLQQERRSAARAARERAWQQELDDRPPRRTESGEDGLG